MLTTTVDCTWPVAMPLFTYLSCIQKKGLTLKALIKDVWTKYRGSNMETQYLMRHASFMLQPKLEESGLSWNEGSKPVVYTSCAPNNRNMTSGKSDHTQSKYNIYIHLTATHPDIHQATSLSIYLSPICKTPATSHPQGLEFSSPKNNAHSTVMVIWALKGPGGSALKTELTFHILTRLPHHLEKKHQVSIIRITYPAPI